MNRRNLFSGFGFGAIASLFGAGKTKADSHPASNLDDIWITHTCIHRVNTDGKFVNSPSRRLFGGESKIEDKNYEILVSKWKSDTELCGTIYRRLHGTNVKCPFCGGYSGAWDSGIPS